MTQAPGITQWFPLPFGAFGTFLRDPLAFLLWTREKFGDVFRFRMGPILAHFVYHPDHVRHVLYDQPKNYLRGWQYHYLRGLVGNNLVVSEGAFWLRQRRLAQPAFARQRLAGYASVMVDATAAMLTQWRVAAAAGNAINIAPAMSRLALAIASRTLFDQDVSHEADTVGSSFAVVNRHLEARLNRPFTTLPEWIPSPGNLRFRRAVRRLNDLVLTLVRERRREGRDHGDLLSMLLQACDEETGEVMTDQEVRSEVLTFLLAGHETTATALSWTWYLLASHPAIQRRLRDEVTSVLGDRTPTPADLQHLPLTRMVVEEAMRLYPPIWALPRQVVTDDEISGFSIPARSTVALCPFVTHRHPGVWEQPEVFDPTRFTTERVAMRPKGMYFPFLGGPHQCIGSEFAMLEMRLIVALVVRAFEVGLVAEQNIRPAASLALRPDGPMWIVLSSVGG